MDDVVYLDNHATTRVDPRVVEAMLPWLSEAYGNAGSKHAYGDAAREAVDSARRTIADAINARPDEIVFTSGATESNNLAIHGVAEHARRRGDHLVSVATEHSAVLDPIRRLERRGRAVTLLDVEQHGSPRAGWLDPQHVAAAMRDDTCLASVMLANNEIGVIQPIEAIAAACGQSGALLHCDATQGVGKMPVDVKRLGVDLMSFTAHKLHGPKGVGALYVRGGRPMVRLEPLFTGGGQERGRRSGTLNVPGIMGFAKAMELCVAEQPDEASRLARLRDRLMAKLTESVDGLELVGPDLALRDENDQRIRLSNNLSVTLPGVDAQTLLLATQQLAASTGATCSATDPQPSHVLKALGLSDDRARGTLRLGLGRFTTDEEVDFAATAIATSFRELRVGTGC